MTEKKYEIFTFKGTLTKCRFEPGYMGKGDKAWRLSLKLDNPLTADIKDKILCNRRYNKCYNVLCIHYKICCKIYMDV